MSARLVAEVLHHAPSDLTPLERLLLVVIAEAAQDHGRQDERGRTWRARECAPGLDALAARCGVQPDSARKALQRLSRRGLEVRVPLGHQPDSGQPVYAHQGHATTYRLPVLPCPSGGTGAAPSCCKAGPSSGQEAGRSSPQEAGPPSVLADERRDADPREAGPSSAEGGTTVPPKQKQPEEPAAAAAAVAWQELRTATGRDWTDADLSAAAARVAERLQSDNCSHTEAVALVAAFGRDRSRSNSLRAVLHRLPTDELQHLLGQHRAAASRQRDRAARLCDHGRRDGQRIVGAGVNASRICGECEAESPAYAELHGGAA